MIAIMLRVRAFSMMAMAMLTAPLGVIGPQRQQLRHTSPERFRQAVIASEAKQSRKARSAALDCFVAPLLAMTVWLRLNPP
ncbi:hypothetical protein [Bosea vaviloviae]|uniref:Secreted protein n=1 Tax=Bosea vaviloviae TaxID=1526658 RepID=A0A1D7U1Y3_9HYPH|nr:hypothetical protein [Bosea vaviloviae]AOO81387.1 hypothetical protein BHK69_13780 [Bosea vaviloviae]